jgi:two-component system, chemotaxis family, protein-glutamate methylesterase/glutaminase
VPNRDLVVVGASAGGVEALIRLVRELPPDLPAAVLVVLHMPPDGMSNLGPILSRAGHLPARQARDGDEIEPGRILVARPDHHLLVRDGRVVLSRGPHENLQRPAIDPLFRSAALNADGRTVGVVLSGALDDGAAGLQTIAQAGGLTVVQDPSDALVPSMPTSAMELVDVDEVLSADDIGRHLPELLRAPKGDNRMDDRARQALQGEVEAAQAGTTTEGTPDGKPSVYGCPDCGGVLWEVDEDGFRFRCRVGHAYTARSLLAAENAGLEDALWAALRALEEQESLSRRMLERGWGSATARGRHEERVEELAERANTLRQFLLSPVFGDVGEATGATPAEAGDLPGAEPQGRTPRAGRRGRRHGEQAEPAAGQRAG